MGDILQWDSKSDSGAGDNAECANDWSAILNEPITAEERKPLLNPTKMSHTKQQTEHSHSRSKCQQVTAFHHNRSIVEELSVQTPLQCSLSVLGALS